MSTRPPGFFSKAANVLRALAGRPLKAAPPLPPLPVEVQFAPGYPSGHRRREAPGRPWRSQYDVEHAAPGISYAEHDERVRSAMARGMTRPSWRVWHGWKPGDPEVTFRASGRTVSTLTAADILRAKQILLRNNEGAT